MAPQVGGAVAFTSSTGVLEATVGILKALRHQIAGEFGRIGVYRRFRTAGARLYAISMLGWGQARPMVACWKNETECTLAGVVQRTQFAG
jgi:hypothetical protein